MPAKLAQPKRLKGASPPTLEKAPTGIRGLDEISGGGLPRGRTTIVCGGPGCGKTMLGMEFLVRGIEEFGEPGVLLSFEETTEEITRNVSSLGFDLEVLARKKKLFLDFLPVEPNDIQEAGDYDLEGLFIRLQLAVDSVGAKRVVLDTLEALFSGFSDMAILRGEVRRLFRWLKERGLTAVVTAEQGEGTLTRHGLEEYVSDCVIFLDHRIQDQISTRRLRIVKYRGTSHSADEYPFLIDEAGLSVLPVTSVALNHKVSSERITTGIADLDVMLEGKGYYRGSSILVSGTSGSGKTTLACHFADASCRRDERCLLVGFEESTNQVFRNAATIGIDLNRWVKKGLLYPTAWRPTQNGMEMHLLRIHKLTDTLKPKAVILDPITNLIGSNTQTDIRSMLMRLLDFLKERGITALFTSLTRGGSHLEATEEQVSSLIDTWILLRDLEQSGERNRCLYILKSRGMAHSNQLREFVISANGIKLLQPYVGAGQVFTGSARLNQEARDTAEALVRKQNIERKESELQAKRRQLEARIADLRAEYQAEEKEMELLIRQTQDVDQNLERNVAVMAASRRADTSPFDTTNRRKLNGAEK